MKWLKWKASGTLYLVHDEIDHKGFQKWEVAIESSGEIYYPEPTNSYPFNSYKERFTDATPEEIAYALTFLIQPKS